MTSFYTYECRHHFEMKTYIGCNKSDFSMAIVDWMGFSKNFIDYPTILHMIVERCNYDLDLKLSILVYAIHFCLSLNFQF
jgi:hypothetical protein